MPFNPRTLLLSGAVMVALVGCQKDKDLAGESGAAPCSGSVASAGADIAGAPGGVVTLDGSASTVCDTASISYNWIVEAVPVDSEIDNGDLDLTDPSHPTFTPDLVGTYVVSLTVNDSSGEASATDLVVIEISPGSSAPVADCGGNQTANVGDRVDFDGSGSSDPEGAELAFYWTLAGTPDCSTAAAATLYNGNTAHPTFVPDCSGTFLVDLVVSDGEQWSAPSQCAVVVGTGNQTPIAEAGPSGNLSPCTDHAYELDGYGSYDPEGTTLEYLWSVVGKPADSTVTEASLSAVDIPNPVLTWDVVGEYTMELRVSDGTVWSAPDIVVLNFQDVADNAIPIANAGADQTITRTPACDTASYVFTCEDCPSDDATLDGSASDDPVDGDELSFSWIDRTGELTIQAPNNPVTTILTPAFPAEYNTTVTRTWDVELAVADCADSDRDTVRVTYNCTGVYSH